MSDSNAKHFDEEVESWEIYTGKPRSAEINEPTHLPILDSFLLSLVINHVLEKPSQYCEQYTLVNRKWMQHRQMCMLEAHCADVERIRVAYDETTTIRN